MGNSLGDGLKLMFHPLQRSSAPGVAHRKSLAAGKELSTCTHTYFEPDDKIDEEKEKDLGKED